MTPAGFEPTITASGRMQTQGLDRGANGMAIFITYLLGAFTKFRKVTYLRHIYTSVRTVHLGSHWKDFR
jgi:hypothetical protein